MKSSATGLSVRFFNVTIPTGQGLNGKSTGKLLSPRRFALKCSMTAGRIARKRPVASSAFVISRDWVVMPVRGTPNPRARKALSTRNPGKLSGVDSVQGLKRAAKADWTYVPYPGGDVPAVTALLGGHVTAVLATYSAVIEQVTSGTLRPLAVTEPVRIPQLPNVPTMAESGFKCFLASRGLGVFAPARAPKEVIAHLSTLFVSALKAPEVTSKLLPQGLPPVGRCGADFAADIREQYDEFGRAVREANIKAE
jgi:hypothetical protein